MYKDTLLHCRLLLKIDEVMNGKNVEEVPLNDTDDVPGKQDEVKLKKTVTVFGGVGLIVGSIIGSGIFLSPSGVLVEAGSIGFSLVIWVACGLIALMGALCYGELGTAIQKSGAEYAYLYEAFGPIPAFLFSWTSTLLIRPSAGAIISMIFAEYVAKPFFEDCDVPEYLIKLLAFFMYSSHHVYQLHQCQVSCLRSKCIYSGKTWLCYNFDRYRFC